MQGATGELASAQVQSAQSQLVAAPELWVDVEEVELFQTTLARSAERFSPRVQTSGGASS